MKKKEKKTVKRKFSLEHFTIVFFAAAVLINLAVSLFVRTTNNNLTIEIQKAQREITTLEIQNEALNYEISQMISIDKLDEIAASTGLSRNADNVVRVDTTSSDVGEGE